MSKRSEDLVPVDFFVFRTPLLPFDFFAAWGARLEAPCARAGSELALALQADRHRLRTHLSQVIERPEVREALFVASPSLAESVSVWLRDPDCERGRKVEKSLVKYFARMASRATPLGLCAGVSTGQIGQIGQETALRIVAQAEYRRRTRLDFYYLGELAFKLFHDQEFSQDVPVRPNTSLHRTGNGLRFAALQQQGDGRVFQFIVADSSPAVDHCLRLAATAVLTPRQLASALVAAPIGLSQPEAAQVVAEMVDVQLLVSALDPPITGPAAVDELIRQLQRHPAGADLASRFSAVRTALADLDRQSVGGTADERYRAIAATLQDLPASIDPAKLYQVDLFKPTVEATLGEAVIKELGRGITTLGRLGAESDPLREFRELFRQRYEENPEEVSLLAVLDPELGLYAKGSAGNSEGTLLDEVELAERESSPRVSFTRADQHRLRLLTEALAVGASEIVLTDEDIELLASSPPPRLPGSLSVHASLAATSQQALRAGDFRLLVVGASGPSGANLLGRFCYGDAAMEAGVRRLLAAEESQRTDAIYAEVVHLPAQERMGNFLQRPLLRPYEIPYLGRSGALAENQIALDDLTVTVQDERVVLRSRTHGKEVLPRLTNAHAFASPENDPIYRFLCSLQQQHLSGGLGYRWGVLDSMSFLPRVTYGKLILSLATWNLQKDELARLATASPEALFQAVQALRVRRKLPRFVLFSARALSDNWLPVDLDNILSIEAWAQLLGKLETGVLREMFPPPDELVAEGPEGRFCHELIVPLVTAHQSASASASASAPARPDRACQAIRTFSMGSQWLYAKVYLGSTPADDLLRDLAPAFARLTAAGAMDRFFFVRYGDPFWHLRIRVHGEPRRLQQEVLPALSEAAARFMGDGVAWRFQLDTYRREIERYGGDAGIELCERIFCADSAASLGILGDLGEEEPPDIRWQLALPGMDRLLVDLGFSLDERLAVLESVASSFRREFSHSPNLDRALSKKHRSLKKTVAELLDPQAVEVGPRAVLLRHFRDRSLLIRPLGVALRLHAARGELRCPLAEIAGSLLHMHINRLLRTHQRPHELVLYDLLLRQYRSQRALLKKPGAPA